MGSSFELGVPAHADKESANGDNPFSGYADMKPVARLATIEQDKGPERDQDPFRHAFSPDINRWTQRSTGWLSEGFIASRSLKKLDLDLAASIGAAGSRGLGAIGETGFESSFWRASYSSSASSAAYQSEALQSYSKSLSGSKWSLFGSIAGAEASKYIIDKTFFPDANPSTRTYLVDAVSPAVLFTGLPWWGKVAVMVGTHTVSRIMDE